MTILLNPSFKNTWYACHLWYACHVYYATKYFWQSKDHEFFFWNSSKFKYVSVESNSHYFPTIGRIYLIMIFKENSQRESELSVSLYSTPISNWLKAFQVSAENEQFLNLLGIKQGSNLITSPTIIMRRIYPSIFLNIDCYTYKQTDRPTWKFILKIFTFLVVFE